MTETDMHQIRAALSAVATHADGIDDGIADAVHEAAAAVYRARTLRGDVISDPEAVRRWVSARLRSQQHETFAVLLLDARHRVIDYREMFRGTIDGAAVHPREVLREVLDAGAAAVVLVHNHPSGVADPSRGDVRITARLKSALELVDVRVLDHLIVGGTDVESMAERGLL